MVSSETKNRVHDTLKELLTREDSVQLHGYTPASGLPSLRSAIAADLRARLNAPVFEDGIYVCCGTEAGLAACCRALLAPGEEAIVLEPSSPELRVFVEAAGGSFCALSTPDPDALAAAVSDKTRLLILSSDRFFAEGLAHLTAILNDAQTRFGHPLYLLAVERYGNAPALCSYDNTVACFPFGEALAMPGERIACLVVSDRAADNADVFARIAGASRAMGYVNTPSLMQRVVERCLDLVAEG